MDGSRFDAWTLRTFGLAAGGLVTALLGLATLDTIEARRRRRQVGQCHDFVTNVSGSEGGCSEAFACYEQLASCNSGVLVSWLGALET